MKGNLHQEKESRVPPGGLCEWAGLLATMAGWVLGHPTPRPAPCGRHGSHRAVGDARRLW